MTSFAERMNLSFLPSSERCPDAGSVQAQGRGRPGGGCCVLVAPRSHVTQQVLEQGQRTRAWSGWAIVQEPRVFSLHVARCPSGCGGHTSSPCG